MNTNVRRLLVAAGAVAFLAAVGILSRPVAAADAENPFAGSWRTRSGSDFVILSIEPGGEALVLMGHGGSFNMSRSTWRSLPGGILVEGLSRFRMWAGPNPNRARVELDLPDTLEMTDNWRTFPRAFFMNRIESRTLPAGWRERPLPEGWENAELDEDWDQRAGKRREAGGPQAEPPGE